PPTSSAYFPSVVKQPNSQTNHQAEASDFSINTQALNVFKGPINLRIAEWSTQRFPNHRTGDTLAMSVTLPESVMPGQPATLHIERSSSDDVGIYYLRLEASGGGRGKTDETETLLDQDGY